MYVQNEAKVIWLVTKFAHFPKPISPVQFERVNFSTCKLKCYTNLCKSSVWMKTCQNVKWPILDSENRSKAAKKSCWLWRIKKKRTGDLKPRKSKIISNKWCDFVNKYFERRLRVKTKQSTILTNCYKLNGLRISTRTEHWREKNIIALVHLYPFDGDDRN